MINEIVTGFFILVGIISMGVFGAQIFMWLIRSIVDGDYEVQRYRQKVLRCEDRLNNLEKKCPEICGDRKDYKSKAEEIITKEK